MGKDKPRDPGIWEARLVVSLVAYVSGDMPEKVEAWRTLTKIARLADQYEEYVKHAHEIAETRRANREQTNGQ